MMEDADQRYPGAIWSFSIGWGCDKLITAADLDLEGRDVEEVPLNLKAAREHADRKVIRHALARNEGNISSTAKMLGISRPTLYDLIKQYDLAG